MESGPCITNVKNGMDGSHVRRDTRGNESGSYRGGTEDVDKI